MKSGCGSKNHFDILQTIVSRTRARFVFCNLTEGGEVKRTTRDIAMLAGKDSGAFFSTEPSLNSLHFLEGGRILARYPRAHRSMFPIVFSARCGTCSLAPQRRRFSLEFSIWTPLDSSFRRVRVISLHSDVYSACIDFAHCNNVQSPCALASPSQTSCSAFSNGSKHTTHRWRHCNFGWLRSIPKSQWKEDERSRLLTCCSGW